MEHDNTQPDMHAPVTSARIAKATGLQHEASDPKASVWVSANAGSGKTHVLVQRIIRLMLHGVPPDKILALTYTKAAAANMATRVFDTLARWVGFDDAKLQTTLQDYGLPRCDDKTLEQARKLFAHAVETPGGLKIQTIHAFCERLLHLFPFEANVAAQFEVLDTVQINALIADAQNHVLRQALAQQDSPLAHALHRVARLRKENSLTDLLVKGWTVLRKAHIGRSAEETLDIFSHNIAQALGIPPDAREEDVEAQISRHALSTKQLQEAHAVLSRGAANEIKTAGRIQAALTARENGQNERQAYLSIFQKSDEGFYKKVSLISKKTATDRPDLDAMLMGEVERLQTLLDLYARVQSLLRSRALFTLCLAIGDYYNAAKARRGALDFDDLIERTLSLLQRSDARWVLFKLDQGIDHLLVDEAQDTSPIQWEILKALTDDFFSGESSRSARRTIFAVGDPKQSIYSFQGAAPESFSQSAHFFETRIKALPQDQGGVFAPVTLQLSFRSSEIILRAVDAIFSPPAHHQGLEHPAKAPAHEARRADLPGLVEIWPLIEAEKQEDTEEWVPALSADAPLPPSVLLAQKIARTIAGWLAPDSSERVHELDANQRVVARPIRAGDILVLVRKRSAFFEAMIRSLKDQSIPVAGADRLSLIDHIAVMDLIALGQAALRPEDDLALACVLKSPLFNLTDADLLTLAPKRTASLAEALAQNPSYASSQTRFALYKTWAKDYGPFGFYARVLNEALAREALISRLGLEAADAIDAFLNAAQEHEYNKTPSLHHFLHDFIEAQTEIKRDMEAGRDEVRVMTVHGAKGLEAPIVFLPETTSVPDGKLLTEFPPLKSPQGAFAVWSLNKTSNPEAVNAALDSILAHLHDEYRRIFYVALTRARERLYIAGFTSHGGSDKIKETSWYAMARTGLAGLATPLDPEQPARSVWRYSDSTPSMPAPEAAQERESGAPLHPAPVWLRQAARAEQEPLPPIKPSSALTAADQRPRPLDTPWQRKAQQRGTLFHRLLELLPQIEPALQAQAARRLIAARGAFLSTDEQDALGEDCLRLLHDPRYADLFGPDSQAEVSISGTIALGRENKIWPVTGQIDRLAKTEQAVLVCDYKTSLAPPKTLDEIPAQSLTQLALYQALLRSLYPDRPVKAFVLYTSSATLFELPDHVTQSARDTLSTYY